MKHKSAVSIIIICLVISFTTLATEAAGNVCFTAINETLMPLNDATMPIIIGSQLYIPCNFFTSDTLGVYYIPGDSQVMLYGASKKITFYIEKNIVLGYDDNYEHYIPAEKRSGRIYVPIDEICAFFGLKYDVMQNQDTPAPVVRFYNGTAYPSKDKFIALNKNKMQAMYDNYISPEPSATIASPEPPTFEDVSVYLSFYDLSGSDMGRVLETFEKTSYKACFFVTADEIEANAGLLRRAVCKGHTIGIRLTDLSAEGAFQEFLNASALLFEAAQVKTVIVTSIGDAAIAAEDMAKAKSLVFWRPTNYYDSEAKLSVTGLTGKLSTVKGTRESLYFACSEGVSGILSPFLFYLSQYEYSIRQITETSIPVMTA